MLLIINALLLMLFKLTCLKTKFYEGLFVLLVFREDNQVEGIHALVFVNWSIKLTVAVNSNVTRSLLTIIITLTVIKKYVFPHTEI